MSYYKLRAGTLPCISLIGLVTIHPPYIHSRRQLDEYVMYIIVSGEMHLKENNTEYILRQNDVIILSPEYEHFGLRATECEYYYIHFKGEIHELQEENVQEEIISERFLSLKNDEVKDIRNKDIIVPNYYHFSTAASVINLICKAGDIIAAGNDKREYYATKTDCMLLEMLIDYTRSYTSELLFETKTSSTKASRKVFDLLNYFNSYYMEEISGDSIEELLDCNFDYLNRVFKQATGKTIFNYLNELRIIKAKQFLENGLHSISDVAEMTGFNDVYYFSKVFKKYAGTTPGKYSKSVL